MRRFLRPALLLLAALALGAGVYTWRARVDTSRAGVEMYRELDGDGYELEPDIVNQPIFEDLLPKSATAEAVPGKSAVAKTPTAKTPTAKTPTAKTPTAKTPTAKAPTAKTPVVKAPLPKASLPKAQTAKTPVPKAPVVKAPVVKTPTAKAAPAKAAPVEPIPPRATSTKDTPKRVAPVKAAPVPPSPTKDQDPAPAPKAARVVSPPAARPAEEQRAPAAAPVASPAAAPNPAPPAAAPTPRLQRLADTSRGTRPNPFGDKVHILLIGTDAERLGEGRADTLLLLTLDPKARTLTTLHVPRDTRLQIFDRGIDKVNHAYALGGAWLTARTLERFFGFPFQHYVEVSLGGFREAVDAIGGVDVDVPFAFSLDGHDFAPGPARLGGDAALAYVRMRKDDPRGDLGRGDRQRQVVLALLDRLGRASPAEARALMDRVAPFVRLDLSPSEIVAMREKHAYALERQRTESLRGVNRRLGGVWYFLPPDAERRRLHLALR